MINLIIPFFILPLFLLGIKELFNHLKNYNEINSTKYFILLILYNVFSLCFISNSNNVYLLLSNIIIILIFFSFNIQKLFYRKIFSIGLFFILIFVELLFLSKYINLVNPNYLKLINKDNLYLINKTDPRSQPLENVALKSLPKNYTEYFTPWANPLYPGSYYKVIQFNNFKKPYLYNPVHNSLKNLHNDQIIQKYIIKNNELISFKKSVYINEDNINLIKYEKKMNIGNSYFFLNNNKKLIKYDNSISDKLAKNIIKDRNFKFILPFDKNLYTLNKKNNFYQVIYNLPKNFPKNLTSSTITKNLKSVNYQIEIDNIKKALLEGNMNQIYQINVNDMIKNKIILNINENDINKINKIYLSFELDYNYLDLAKKNYDNYEFNYYSEQDGYLLINMPYDNKWSIKVNDNASEIYKANKYFMAIKISKGHNLIEMGYMNNTLLRNLLYISICLIFFSLMYIHYNILRNPIN